MPRVMKRLLFTALCGGVLYAGAAEAQLARPNAAGVSMGHLHFYVSDVDANRKFWIALGATSAGKLGASDVLKLPGVLIVLTPSDARMSGDGTVVGHMSFRVKSFKQLEAAGFTVRTAPERPGSGNVDLPSGDHIEVFEENANQVGFVLDAGHTDASAERHNRPMTGTIATHHLHFYLPAGADTAAQEWYVQRFGGVPGVRLRYKAADLPGINLNFSDAPGPTPMVPTKGRTLDHIGFEVVNLEAFCAKLAASGVRFDVPYRKTPTGLGVAFFTDPWGTYVELTEGLSGL
jgi:catechol 2,3-dioxygenase-like lactoylglutathione lyase family enzyme